MLVLVHRLTSNYLSVILSLCICVYSLPFLLLSVYFSSPFIKSVYIHLLHSFMQLLNFHQKKILEMKEAVFEVKNMFRKRFKESCFWCFHRLTKDLIMVQASNIDTFRQTITGQKRFFEQFRNVL